MYVQKHMGDESVIRIRRAATLRSEKKEKNRL